MRIAAIDTTLGSELIGGAQTFLAKLASGLSSKSHEVHLISKGEPSEKIGAQIRESGADLHAGIWNTSGLVDDEALVLAEWINALSPDIFLVSVSPDIGWAVLPLLDPGIATINIAHSNSNGFYCPLKHYSAFMTRSIGVSEEICAKFHGYCHVDRENIEWIPYGVIPSDDETSENMPLLSLIYVGRLAEIDKKVSDLIKIVKRLRKSEIEYSLKIIGDGPMRPEFDQEIADEIGVGKVQMLGWIENRELLEYLRQSDISLLVSESEGFCIALVEAMANGCCPIVTDIESGNKQLVRDGENGFMVPVGDVEAFVEKIELLAKTPEKLLELRQRAWETGKQYSVERMVDAYEAAFERAVEDARKRPRRPDPDFPLMESCRSKYPLWLRRIKAKAKSFV
jgi:glycosyltransferase involved in cell wall biosynthesis